MQPIARIYSEFQVHSFTLLWLGNKPFLELTSFLLKKWYSLCRIFLQTFLINVNAYSGLIRNL